MTSKSKPDSRRKIRLIFGLILIGVVALVAYLLVSAKITTVFNVTAVTERLEFKILDNNNSTWNFAGVKMLNRDVEVLEENFSGTLRIFSGTHIRIDRFGSGPAYIIIQNNDGQPIGQKKMDEASVYQDITEDYLEILLDSISTKAANGTTHILPIKGNIRLGGDIDYEINGEGTAVLKEGTVSMQGYSSLRKNEYFEAGTEHLKLGDELVFKENEPAVGFARLGDQAGIEVAYRVEAKEATIIKPGPVKNGYKISATLLDKFVNDKGFQAVSVLVGFLFVIFTMLTFFMDAYNFYHDKLKNKNQ
jgi:hypothetical protein